MNDASSSLRQRLQEILSSAGGFPDLVARLAALGVERYHTDYSRQETTYYLPDGQSVVISQPHPPLPIGQTFSAIEVEKSVRRSQRQEHTYADFLRETMQAGCVGYFAQITGRRVLYFGRNGEVHQELMPAAS
ncbi:hypothetical protein Pan44_00150 [Caulifigura coniformis]|uniref:DUF1398 domain-containing protein n=1 Tax=Caulifigura coniformis TaxID=2527983 RepID=A0A517S7A5_9PLAN|nr:DUF1398 family protein [Caulifigura coniformis]QDT52008.1 hypothetical protein Pan44_00150 [Caulifigura coniformis]